MSLRSQLYNPWFPLAATVFGGLTWAVGAPGVAGAAVAAAVYGVAVGVGALTGDGSVSAPVSAAAEAFVSRARSALGELSDLCRNASATSRPSVESVSSSASETFDTLSSLAAQVALVESALARVDLRSIEAERYEIRSRMRVSSAAVSAELQGALSALDAQVEVAQRLSEAHSTALARLQAATISLEGLVASVAEVLTMESRTHDDLSMRSRLRDLDGQLVGLRSGLAETEEVSRRLLQAV